MLLAACSSGGEQPSNLSAEDVAGQLAQIRIESGLWERRTEVTDVRAQAVPHDLIARLRERGGTTRHCITPEQAARPDAQFLAGREDARCQSRSFTMDGGQMAGEMACADPQSGGEWTARLEGRYGERDYALDVTMEMPSPFDPGQLSITSRVSGRRIGDCPAAGAPEKGGEE